MGFHGDLDGGFDNPVEIHDGTGSNDPRNQQRSSTSSQHPNDYTNIFGSPKTKSDYFIGVRKQGTGNVRDVAKTQALVDKLSLRMMRKADWEGQSQVNRKIPAGYTYFGQMIAHDLVQSSTPFSGGGGLSSPQRDFRDARLVLDTIYGGGPGITPLAYEPPDPTGDGVVLLRMGPTKMEGDGEEASSGPVRDFSRGAGCPFAADNTSNMQLRRDVYVADPRNDDNFFVSQLSTLFFTFHNLIYRSLSEGRFDDYFAVPNNTELKRFSLARRITALVYRRAVENDFLKKILNEDVWKLYTQGKLASATLGSQRDQRMPVEFSHAAFRLGHAMVLDDYKVNDTLSTEAGVGSATGHLRLSDALRSSSARFLKFVPIKATWLISWSKFFKVKDPANPQSSRRISPFMAGALRKSELGFFPNVNGNGTGLIFRDLLRSTNTGLRSVKSIMTSLETLLEPVDGEIFEEYRRQFDSHWTETVLGAWLNAEDDIEFSTEEISQLLNDPPLFFYLLFEAYKFEDGFKWGFMSSVIVAEVIFSAKNQTKIFIEDDPEVNELAQIIFENNVPDTMPEIIGWIAGKVKDNPDFNAGEGDEFPAFI